MDETINIALAKFSWEFLPEPTSNEVGVIFLTSSEEGELKVAKKEHLKHDIIEEKLIKIIDDKVEKTTSSCKRFGYIIYKGKNISTEEAMNHFGIKVINDGFLINVDSSENIT